MTEQSQYKAFLTEFVPHAERQARTRNNEIESLHRIVDSVFYKFGNRRIQIKELEHALDKLGYDQKTGGLSKDDKVGMVYSHRFSKHSGSGSVTYNTYYLVDVAALKEL